MVSVAKKQRRDALDVRENGTVTGKTCTGKGNGNAKIPSANKVIFAVPFRSLPLSLLKHRMRL